MPTAYNLTLQLEQPAPSTLETSLHGMIHHQLAHTEQHLPEPERISTQLHDNQQAHSLRVHTTQRHHVQLTLELLHDPWAETFTKTFQANTRFGQDHHNLQGHITHATTHAWTLQNLQDHTQNTGPFTQIKLEFVSPTVFTHKKANWDSPHPDLVLRSLEARWQHAGGPALHNAHDLLESITQVHYTAERGQIPIGKQRGFLPAFVGTLHLHLAGPEPTRHDLATLVAFGARVNAGKRVAYGCGQIEAQGLSENGWVRLGQTGMQSAEG